MTDCPGAETLQRLLRNELTGQKLQEVNAHVQSCARCDEALARLTAFAGGLLTQMLVCPPGQAEAALPAVRGYRLLEKLGQGGMGVVYKAEQVGLNRLVALKMISGGAFADEDALARFRTEAEAAARIRHPHIMPIYEVGGPPETPFFSMEFAAGGSLKGRLDGTPWPARAAAELVEPLARAMHHAHQQRILHRDLKPANVLLSEEGVPKVGDFGLAKLLDRDGSATGTERTLGTPSYMAPEQAVGQGSKAGPAVDVYGLGAILYELLTGRPPFKGETALDTLEQVRTQEPVPVRRLQPKVPRDLETVCHTCLRKEPEKRYASAAALADDLRRFQDGRPVVARPVSAAGRAWRWCRRNPRDAALVGVLAALLLTGVVAGGAWLWGERARAERMAATARAVEEDVAEAEAMFAQALAEPGIDLEPLEVVLTAAVVRASGRLEDGDADAVTRKRVDSLRDTLDGVKKDRQLVKRLVEIRALRTDRRPHTVIERDCREALRESGIDVDTLTPADAAALIRRRVIRLELAVALDALVALSLHETGRLTAEAKRLLAIARAADADAFRNQVRDALEDEDLRPLERLAELPHTTDLPQPSLALLGAILACSGEVRVTERLLRRAQWKHPANAQINYSLGFLLVSRLSPPRLDEGIRFYQTAFSLSKQNAGMCLALGYALSANGQPDDALAAFQEAVRLRPDRDDARAALANTQTTLDLARERRKGLDEATRAIQQTVRVQPDHARAYYHFGHALQQLGRRDEAIAAWENATRIRPDYAEAYHPLGMALYNQGRREEAITAFQRAVELRKDHAEAHSSLGGALATQGRFHEALDALHEAVRLKPALAEAHGYLGLAFQGTGRFTEALAAFKLCQQLSSKNPRWADWSARAVRRCESYVALDGQLPAILNGEAEPVNALVRAEFAYVCARKRLVVAAARLYEEAFAAQPALAADTGAGYRYEAARSGARAGCGQGEDVAPLDEGGRARWRRQALEWLRADLWLLGQEPLQRSRAREYLPKWQREPELKCVRDAAELDKLPREEQQAWRQFWADVEELLKRARAAK